ncbi:MAG: hypothetical protein ACXWX4_06875, partial [Actinomycetota bacterium]
GDNEAFDLTFERADRGWAEFGNPQEKVAQNQQRAESLWRLGREAEAEARVREAKVFLDGMGETGFNSTMTSLLATFLAETGRFDEADALIEEARPMASADDFGALGADRMGERTRGVGSRRSRRGTRCDRRGHRSGP